MVDKSKFIGSLTGIGLFLVLIPSSILATKAEMRTSLEETNTQFQKIEQLLGLKITVALVGISLISAELWCFLLRNKAS